MPRRPFSLIDPNFKPDRQGARLRRLIPKLSGKPVTGRVIGEIIGVTLQSANRKLSDDRNFSKQEIESIAKHFGIEFDRLYVPRLEKADLTLKHVLKDPDKFFGARLDSIARDQVVKALLKIKEYVDSNRQVIGARRRHESDRQHKLIVTKYIFAHFLRDYKIKPYQLVDIKNRTGTYGPYQDKFDELWAQNYPRPDRLEYIKKWLKDNDLRTKRPHRKKPKP